MIKAIKLLSKNLNSLDGGEIEKVIDKIINEGSFLIEKIQKPFIGIFKLMIIISVISLLISLILLAKRMLDKKR